MPGQVEGVVKWYNSDKGYGFIKRLDGEKDAFVHSRDLEKSEVGEIDEGDRLLFDVETGPKGAKAINLSRLD